MAMFIETTLFRAFLHLTKGLFDNSASLELQFCSLSVIDTLSYACSRTCFFSVIFFFTGIVIYDHIVINKS